MLRSYDDISQISLLKDLLVALDVVAHCEIRPIFESDTALCILAHLGDVLLDVLEGNNRAYKS
jgi:hypothetical protein